MTTVCWDGKKLVSDSFMSLDNMILPAAQQKIFCPAEGEWWGIHGIKVIAFGFSGSMNSMEFVKDLLRTGLDHKSKIDEAQEHSVNVICILETGESYIISSAMVRGRQSTVLLAMGPPLAVGSGENFAYAVMSTGKDSIAGVKTASKLDAFTGGDLQVWEFPGVPDVLSVRPGTEAPTDAEKPITRAEVEGIVKHYVDQAKQPLPEPGHGHNDAGIPLVGEQVQE